MVVEIVKFVPGGVGEVCRPKKISWTSWGNRDILDEKGLVIGGEKIIFFEDGVSQIMVLAEVICSNL